MGVLMSKFEKLKKAKSNSKVREIPQAKLDKEEMKEPPNYYSNRSKSMRRKAGKEAGSTDIGGAATTGPA
jgi:hypothetical protein